MTDDSPRDCTYCERFDVQEAVYWSPETGGDPASIGCALGHWTLGDDRTGWDAKGFRLAVAKGRDCADFKRTNDEA